MLTIAPTQPTIPTADPGWIPSPLFRMTVEQYEAMVASGAFSKRDRFHLINGYLVAKMTQNPPHMIADDLCGAELARLIPADRYYIRVAQPVRLPDRDSEPEPDRCVVARDDPRLRGPASRAGRHRPGRRGRRLQPGGRPQAGRRGLRAGRAPGLLDHQPGPSPGRGPHRPGAGRLPVARRLLGRAVRPPRDRRAAGGPDRRRRHLAVATGGGEPQGQRGLNPGAEPHRRHRPDRPRPPPDRRQPGRPVRRRAG